MIRSDMPADIPPITRDLFLGDKLVISQPKKGYRAGVDAVLLAACVDAAGPATLLDVGAGAGTVGLCAAVRLTQLQVVLLEREPALAALAQQNIEANGLAGRARAVCAQVTSTAGELDAHGLLPDSFDYCVANPPFHDESAGTLPPNAFKAGSHAMPEGALEDWARFLARMVRPGGKVAMIHKAEALEILMAVMGPRFGALTVFPIFPRPGETAIRVIVRGVKGSRAPLRLRPGLILHGHGNAFTPEATDLLRHGAALKI